MLACSHRCGLPGSGISAASGSLIADSGFAPTPLRVRGCVDTVSDGFARVRRMSGSVPPTSWGARRDRLVAVPDGAWMLVAPLRGAGRAALLVLRTSQREASGG